MAKIDLKFIANDSDDYALKVSSDSEQIVIKTYAPDKVVTVCLDKSTAIRFAKTLRTEINKIQD